MQKDAVEIVSLGVQTRLLAESRDIISSGYKPEQFVKQSSQEPWILANTDMASRRRQESKPLNGWPIRGSRGVGDTRRCEIPMGVDMKHKGFF
jgi:hypothetical protein